jgi:MFS family permease
MAALTVGPGFGRLWTSSLLSNVSDGIRAAAFPLLAASLTRDPLLVAGVTAAQQLPWLVAGPLAGVVVDRGDRRRILWSVNAARATIFGALTVAIVSESASLWQLYLAAAALGIGESLYDNAAQTVVPAIVAPGDLERANGRLVAAEVVGNEFAGPPIGALLFGVAVALPFAGSTAALVVATVLVVGLAGSFRPAGRELSGPVQGAWAELMEGIRFVARHRELGTVTLLAGVFSAADAAWFAILVLYSLEVLGLSEAGFGLLLASGALGGILGAVCAERLSTRVPRWVVITGTLVAAAVAQLLLGLTSSPALAVFLIAVSSLLFAVWNVVVVSLRQRVSPPHLLGRVNATYRSVAMGAAPLGALLGGAAGHQLGVRAPFLLGVPLLLAAAGFGAVVLPRQESRFD